MNVLTGRKNAYRKMMFVYVAILSVYTVITVIPLWYVYINAFKDLQSIFGSPMAITPKSFTFDNFFAVWKLMKYPRIFMNNVLYLVVSCTLIVLISAPAGFGIGTSRGRFMKKVYVLILFGITVPFQLYMIPLVIQFKVLGLTNTYLGTSLMYTVVSISFATFLYASFVRTVPNALYEAAATDGCSPMRILLQVYLPILSPVTGTVLMLRGIFTWNNELIPLISIFSASKSNLVLSLYSFASANLTRWDYVFAATVLTSLPITIFFILFQKVFVRGIAAGSVKG